MATHDNTEIIETWLEENGPLEEADRDDLVNSINTKTTQGQYQANEKGGKLVVACGPSAALNLTKAQTATLLELLDQMEFEDPDDLDAAFDRAIANPHS